MVGAMPQAEETLVDSEQMVNSMHSRRALRAIYVI